MALTRKYLTGLGIEADKIDLIIDAHAETVTGLKTEIAEYKEKAEKATQLETENEQLKAQAGTDSEWKSKYEKEHSDFEAYKAEQEQKATAEAKVTAYKELLKANGVSEKLLDLIVRGTDLNTIELDEGKIKDSDKLSATIKEDYKDYITTQQGGGVSTENPPAGGGTPETDLGKLSMAEYIEARKKQK